MELTTEKKKVLVETWGCQMNVADSETMLSQLKKLNYEITDVAEDADLVVLNTCHIREKAKQKVLSRLGVLRDIRDKTGNNMQIAVAGCVAQAEGKKLLQSAPQIDILLGPGTIHELPNLISVHAQSQKQVSALGFKEHAQKFLDRQEPSSEAKPVAPGMNAVSRYVNITQGCDNFCTFCIVPHTRGREISRQPGDIISEVQTFLASGAKEITLLGQNVNSYGTDLVREQKITPSNDGAFVDLLRRVGQLPGVESLRFTTSNPHDFTRPLANLFHELPSLGRYIHLPVQSGDNVLLERMRRKVTVEEYLTKIGWLRALFPDFAISTDLIVGFPGETNEQFENTMKLVEQVGFTFVFSFKYSPRKNTAAYRFQDQIPEDVKETRLARLNALQNQISLNQQLAEIGKTRQVICAYGSRKEPGIYYGRTPHFRLVRMQSSQDVVGKLLEVKIIDANKTALLGEIIH